MLMTSKPRDEQLLSTPPASKNWRRPRKICLRNSTLAHWPDRAWLGSNHQHCFTDL